MPASAGHEKRWAQAAEEEGSSVTQLGSDQAKVVMTRAPTLPRSLAQITKVPENLLPFAVRCRNLTVSNTRTVLLTPEIYVNQNVYEQLVDLMLETLRGARKCSCAVPQPQHCKAALEHRGVGQSFGSPCCQKRGLCLGQFTCWRTVSNSLVSPARV